VIELCYAICENLDGTEALRRVGELERKQQRTDETARLAYNTASKALEKVHGAEFMTGAEIKAEQATKGRRGGS
jgi:hypothetical protein